MIVFPSDFVYWTDAKDHENMKQLVMERVKNQQLDEAVAVNTEPHDEPDLQGYAPFMLTEVYPALHKMFDEMPFLQRPSRMDCTKIWFVEYNEGAHLNADIHRESQISGCYFAELNEPNTTLFTSYTGMQNEMFQSMFRPDFIKEGQIMFFPSHLLRSVLPSTKHQVVVLFDVKLGFGED